MLIVLPIQPLRDLVYIVDLVLKHLLSIRMVLLTLDMCMQLFQRLKLLIKRIFGIQNNSVELLTDSFISCYSLPDLLKHLLLPLLVHLRQLVEELCSHSKTLIHLLCRNPAPLVLMRKVQVSLQLASVLVHFCL